MVENRVLPVLPIRGNVLFPAITVPVAVRSARALRAIEFAAQSDGWLFAVAQREDVDDPEPEQLYTVGVIARIAQLEAGRGGMRMVVIGQSRARAVEYNHNEHFSARVETIAEIQPEHDSQSLAALRHETKARALELGAKRGIPGDVWRHILDSIDGAGELADLIATFLDLSVGEKQSLLETISIEDRLRRVIVLVQEQLELARARQDIDAEVQEELADRQRDFYLREQMKAIQKELGEDHDADEIAELRKKLDELELPEPARAEIERELARLARMELQAVEAQVIRTYLGWMLELPWSRRSDDVLDLSGAARVLDEDHFALDDVKARVLEFLATRVLRARHLSDGGDAKSRALARGPILLFAGPPGVGKTSIGRSIARALGRRYVRISLGGARDDADIRGHRRTYVGAMPGRIIQGLRQAGTKNPVFMLDEIDKLGVSYQGDPGAALLEVLDPEQNDSFTDHYLNVPFDLSEVLFIATANVTHPIPPALLDRMEAVSFAGYIDEEKTEIARRYLLRRQLEESGLSAEQPAVTFADEAIATIIARYTRESGVRQLERELGSVSRKIARRVAAGEPVERHVTSELVRELLGRPKVHPEHAIERDEIGTATGIYYSPTGGDVMFVEAAVRRCRPSPTGGAGTTPLILTGQLGEVMKESARAALTYAATHASELGIAESALTDIEAHIHVPAGAVPKDGPSAGVTIAVALISALARRPVKSDVAMTGEITLRGRVLPIGGLKEKVIGAHRAGVGSVILPRANAAELEDVPQSVKNELEFVLVDTLHDVLEIALARQKSPERPFVPRARDARSRQTLRVNRAMPEARRIRVR